MYNPYQYQFQQQPMRPQTNCYFVSSASELNGINYMPNTYYLGINLEGKEIYLKHLKNDGLVESTVYKLQAHQDEKSIIERLNDIERKLKEMRNAGTNNKKSD